MNMVSKIEDHIVRRTAERLIARGFEIRVHDGEEDACDYTSNISEVMSHVGHTDETCFKVRKPKRDGEAIEYENGWVQFIHGNGFYVMSAHTTNLQHIVSEVSAYVEGMETYQGLVTSALSID